MLVEGNMATKDETETIILINQGDLADGFFRFYTCHKPHIARFWRIVPRSECIITQEGDSVLQVKAPIKYIGKGFNIKKPAARPKLTDEQRTESILRLRKSSLDRASAREKQKVGG